jgi:hypothetical protein
VRLVPFAAQFFGSPVKPEGLSDMNFLGFILAAFLKILLG